MELLINKKKGDRCYFKNRINYNLFDFLEVEVTKITKTHIYVKTLDKQHQTKHKFEIVCKNSNFNHEICEFGYGGTLFPSKAYYETQLKIDNLKNTINATLLNLNTDDVDFLESILKQIDKHKNKDIINL